MSFLARAAPGVRAVAVCVGLVSMPWNAGVGLASGTEEKRASQSAAATSPFPPTGACCLVEGGCSVTTLAECLRGGDLHVGNGTTCGRVDCKGVRGRRGCAATGCPEGCYAAGCGGLGQEEIPVYRALEPESGLCPHDVSQTGLNRESATDVENVVYGPPIGCADCYTGLSGALLKAFRSTALLETPSGRRFVSLYYHHGHEVANILRANPGLRRLAGSRVNDFMPAVRWYLYKDKNGVDFILDGTRMEQIQEVVEGLKAHASPGLRIDLDKFLVDVSAQLGKPMSEAIEGMLALVVP